MVGPATIATAVGVLKLAPDIVEVGKNVWKKLKPPEKLTVREGKDGVSGNTYYSGQYGFTISIPDDNWRFWEPTPGFKSGFGPLFTMPWRDMPIMAMSRQMVRLFRPNVIIMVEDVGSFTTIEGIMNATVQGERSGGTEIEEDNIHISNNTNSGVWIGTRPYIPPTVMYQVQQMYLYASRAYLVNASYVPVSDQSLSLFGGLQDIMNSFQLIK